MELLRYLTKDHEDYVNQVMWYTLQSDSDVEPQDQDRQSVIMQEMIRSVPMSMEMFEGLSRGRFILNLFTDSEMWSGQPYADLLSQYAQRYDIQFKDFLDDLEHYSTCMKNGKGLCSR